MSDSYSIKQFSLLTSTTPDALRYYDEIGLLVPMQRSIHGYRFYSNDDLLRLQKIAILKFLGYSLPEIKPMLSIPQKDNSASFKTQVASLVEKARVARHAAWLMEKIILQLEKQATMNWEIVYQIMSLLKSDEENEMNWQKHFYTESEYDELVQVTLQYPAEWWEEDTAEWVVLFKKVEDQLHLDPEGERGMLLAEEWLAKKDKIQMSPALAKKKWEAFQKGIVPQQVFAYNPQVVAYITKAIAHYRREKNSAEGKIEAVTNESV